jgi:hypothetical protein
MKKLLGCFLCVVLLIFGAQANALTISPSLLPSDCIYYGNDTSQSSINAIIAPIIDYADELYKQNAGGSEEGALASSYTTSFNGDLSGGTITYESGPFIADPFLLVKDGNHEPAWYLFDLTGECPSLDWNGKDTLELSGFWLDNGAISHVTLYGNPVPEPTTMLLLGSGLAGLAGFGRKRFKK